MKKVTTAVKLPRFGSASSRAGGAPAAAGAAAAGSSSAIPLASRVLKENNQKQKPSSSSMVVATTSAAAIATANALALAPINVSCVPGSHLLHEKLIEELRPQEEVPPAETGTEAIGTGSSQLTIAGSINPAKRQKSLSGRPIIDSNMNHDMQHEATITNPFLIDIIMKNILDHTSIEELKNYRLVSKTWNYVACEQLRQKQWISLGVKAPFLNNPLVKNSIQIFMNDMSGTAGLLIPLRKFKVDIEYDNAQWEESTTGGGVLQMDTEFVTNQFPFISHLDLSVSCKNTSDPPIWRRPHSICNYNLLCLSPELLPSLAELTIRMSSNLINSQQKFHGVYRQLKVLKIYQCCFPETISNENSFIYQLLQAGSNIETFIVRSAWQMEKILGVVYKQQLHRNIKHLRLENSSVLDNAVAIGPPAGVRFPFKLKSFQLINVIVNAAGLTAFLEAHRETLIDLKINIDIESGARYVNGYENMHSAIPTLPCLQKINLFAFNSYFNNDMLHFGCFRGDKFPQLTHVTLGHLFKGNYEGRIVANQAPSPNPVYNHGSIKYLEIFHEKKRPFPAFLRQLNHLEQLKLHIDSKHLQSMINVKNPIISSENLTKLSLVIYDKSIVGNLDSIITGLPEEVCLGFLDEIRQISFDEFELSDVAIEDWEAKKPASSKMIPLAKLNSLRNLQKMELLAASTVPGHAWVSTLHLSEVGLIYIIKSLKSLTAIEIGDSLIANSFVRRLRSLLHPGFSLVVRNKNKKEEKRM